MLDGYVGLTRNDLVEMLKARLPPTCTIHTGKRLTSYSSTGDVFNLEFADGTTETADVLIGADGIRSVVRAQMFENLRLRRELPQHLEDANAYQKMITPSWTGTVIYRALIPIPRLKAIFPDHPVLTSTSGVCVSKSDSSCQTLAHPNAVQR